MKNRKYRKIAVAASRRFSTSLLLWLMGPRFLALITINKKLKIKR